MWTGVRAGRAGGAAWSSRFGAASARVPAMLYVQMLDGGASDATASTLTRQHKLGYARWPAARARVNSLISDKGKKNTLDLVIEKSKELYGLHPIGEI